MHLIAPDILVEGRGLSLSVLVVGILLGWLLWLFGWRWHRFWTVVGVTIAGGIYGLSSGLAGHGHVLALGLLLAVSAGLLAMEIARLLAFVAGGTAVWWAVGMLFPKAQELWGCFLAGGLAGILFYRLWLMTLTSFIGTLIAGHALLMLVDRLMRGDVVTWSSRNPLALSIAVGVGTMLGLAAQGAQYRWRQADPESNEKPKKKRPKKAKEPEPDPPELEAIREALLKKKREEKEEA